MCPPDRVALLRQAPTKMVGRPEFLADARKRGLEITPASGRSWTDIVHAPFDASVRPGNAEELIGNDLPTSTCPPRHPRANGDLSLAHRLAQPHP